jgi:hypothetical protein
MCLWSGIGSSGGSYLTADWSLDWFDLCQKPIPAASDGFHKARGFRGVTECLAKFIDGFIQTLVEIHKSVCWPEFLLKFFPGNDFARVLEKHGEYLKGLSLKTHPHTVLA